MKMKRPIGVGVMLGSLLMLGCQKNNQAQLENDAQLMAQLECQARQLKEERFKAANDIRFMEDSLAKYKLRLSPQKSAEIDSVKESYTIRTGELADKITKTMDSLFATTYRSQEERQQLDEATEKVLQKICQ